MNFLIIQEAGRHEANKQFRESISLKNSINRIEGNTAEVWGKGYPRFNEFEDLEKWADVIFTLENYTPEWLPVEKISNSKKIKIYWSIDSHMPADSFSGNSVLQSHVELCDKLKPDIHLNSTECYVPYFNRNSRFSYWFPNAYPSDLITPINIEKKYDIGFCGSILHDRAYILTNVLGEFKPKIDNFVIGNEMVKAINSYKIHFNKNISNDINYRTFETLGCKTFLLTNYTPGLEKLFDIGRDLVTYENFDDLKDKVKYYLKNDSERETIASNGYNTVIKKHTYDSRCKYLLRIISGTSK